MNDLEQMLIFAARYALTKDNYAVSVTVNYLLENEVSTPAKNIILQDIAAAYKTLYTPAQQQWIRIVKQWGSPKLLERLKQ